MTKPPILATGREISASRMAATPANVRTTLWNHMVRPSVTSRTPMISEPAPAVVDMASVMLPRCMLAYGKYAMGTPPAIVNRPAQNGRLPRQARKRRRQYWKSREPVVSALMENSSLEPLLL